MIYKIKISGGHGPWQTVFAWKPVKIKGRWFWLQNVYKRRKHIYVYPDKGYEYGTIFDVLEDG